MSKVLKSFTVKMESPVLIEHDPQTAVDNELAAADAKMAEPEKDELEGIEPEAYMAQVRAQADEILRETEEMVKDLLKTARQEAEKIITNANEEAAQAVSQGREQAKQIEQESQQQGWQDGYGQAVREAGEEYADRLEEAQNIVEKAHQERQEIIAGSEDEIVQLAMAVARKVISNELIVNPGSIVEIVKRAILKAADREEVTVRVNPENLDTTISARDEISQSFKGIRKFKVLADASVTPGGCVVETPNGNVDARIERQLGEIEQVLLEVGSNV